MNLFRRENLLKDRRLLDDLYPLGEAERRETEPVIEMVLLQILKKRD